MTGHRILYHHRIRADDGQAVHVRELIGALREAGHEVLECALVPKSKSGAASQPERASRSRLWQSLALPRVVTELLEIGYGRQGARRLVAAGREFRPDFVYERHALHCDAGLRAARALGVPLLLEVNSPLCDEMARLGLLRFARRARRTERAVLSGADAVLAVTRVLADILCQAGADPRRTHVVANGAVPSRYDDAARARGRELRAARGIGPRDFVLGFVGYMRPWHRLDRAIEMLARPEFTALHLWLVGEGPALEQVAALAVERGVAARVHAVGSVAPGALPEHVCAFDAALIPAINGYASPLKLFDSLAAGVATIAPDQPNLREIVTDGVDGVLFDPGRPQALEQAVAALLGDRARSERIGRQGRASLLANDWTWGGNARRVVEVFESLARGVEVARR